MDQLLAYEMKRGAQDANVKPSIGHVLNSPRFFSFITTLKQSNAFHKHWRQVKGSFKSYFSLFQ